ncbi:MAG: hypothetical protein HOM11_00815 [Methylococcales bacterium]|jgi:hypothetical protein|nr:hypothetical protein [Methylococcales bacterium]MBT7444975.1 hypothetical protein [Methylococcales bacterium]
MKGRIAVFCRVSFIGLLCVSSAESFAWSKPVDPIAAKHHANQLVYRPDARFDKPAFHQYESPKLQQEENQWVWNSAQKKRVSHRPWGNYDFSRPRQASYYTPGYRRDTVKYRYPSVNSYQVTDANGFRVNQQYTEYQSAQASYPQYTSGYDNRYYQSSAYPLQGERRARVYQVSEPQYSYNPMVVDQSSTDYYVSPYAYDLY